MINKGINMVIGLVMLLVALSIVFGVAPSLLGSSISAANTGYINNATGCHIDINSKYNCSAVPCSPNVPVNSIYCTGFTIYPILIVVGFFVAVLGIVLGGLKIKGKL